MPRQLKVKDIQNRIKKNKAFMRKRKQELMAELNKAINGQDYSHETARKTLSQFYSCVKLVEADTTLFKKAAKGT